MFYLNLATLVKRIAGIQLVILASQSIADGLDIKLPERRGAQFLTDPGYYIVPTPYSIPGIGSGLIVVGAMTNIQQTNAEYMVLSQLVILRAMVFLVPSSTWLKTS